MKNLSTHVILGLALTSILVGCANQAQEVKESTNQEFTVDKLFNVDSCTVYRFYDAGHYRYFAKCATSISVMSEYDQQCGKNNKCPQPDELPTEMVK